MLNGLVIIKKKTYFNFKTPRRLILSKIHYFASKHVKSVIRKYDKIRDLEIYVKL